MRPAPLPAIGTRGHVGWGLRRRAGDAGWGGPVPWLAAWAAVMALAGASGRPAAAGPVAPQAPQAPLVACQSFRWERVAGPDKSITALAAWPGFDQVFAASQDAGGIGTTFLWTGRVTDRVWSAVSGPGLGGLPLTDVVVTPEITGEPSRVWVSVFGDGNVFGSATGESQTFSAKGNLTGWVMRLAATPTTVLAAASKPGAQQGIWAWAGTDWARRNDGATMDTPYFRSFAASADGRVLWLGTDARGLWRSTDGGSSWTQLGAENALTLATVRSLAVDPTDAHRVLAGLGRPHDPTTYNGARGLRVFADGQLESTAWTDRDIDLVAALAFGQRSVDTVYAAVWGHGLQVSHDRGRTWQSEPAPIEQPFDLEALLVVVPPTDPACELLFAGGRGGLWVRNVARPTVTLYAPVSLRSAAW
jgi:hypothetical protein